MFDVLDAPLAVFGQLHGAQNDGLVSVCSSKLGQSLGVYAQNHLDEVNQLLGFIGPLLGQSKDALPPARQPPASGRLVNQGSLIATGDAARQPRSCRGGACSPAAAWHHGTGCLERVARCFAPADERSDPVAVAGETRCRQ